MDILFNETFIQILGLIGAVIGVIRMQMADRKQILLYHSWLCIPFGVHYALMGGTVAALQCLVGFFRTLLLAQEGLCRYRHMIAAGCVGFVTLICLPFLSDPLGWFTLGSLYIGVLGEVQKNPLILRISIIASSASWLTFSVLLLSYGGILITAATMLSCLVGIYRHHIKPAKVKASEKLSALPSEA